MRLAWRAKTNGTFIVGVLAPDGQVFDGLEPLYRALGELSAEDRNALVARGVTMDDFNRVARDMRVSWEQLADWIGLAHPVTGGVALVRTIPNPPARRLVQLAYLIGHVESALAKLDRTGAASAPVLVARRLASPTPAKDGRSSANALPTVRVGKKLAFWIREATGAPQEDVRPNLRRKGGTKLRMSDDSRRRPSSSHPTVLALDFEGTLISTAVSQFPRPGLFHFLERCQVLFERIVMFTSVPENQMRRIAQTLVREGAAPAWFQNVEYVQWGGATKNLALIRDCEVSEVLLVDDLAIYVHRGQHRQWVRIDPFEPPYPGSDTGLAKVLKELEQRLRT